MSHISSNFHQPTKIAYLSDLDIQWIMPKCSECKQKFDVFERTPYILPCCHTICWECLTKLNKRKQRKCPTCCVFYRTYQINLAYLNLITRLNVFQNSHSYTTCNECFQLAPVQKMRRCVSCESYVRSRYDFPRVSCVVCLECAADIHSGHHLSKESSLLAHIPIIDKGQKGLSQSPVSIRQKLKGLPNMIFGKNDPEGRKISEDTETSIDDDDDTDKEDGFDLKNSSGRMSFRLKKWFSMKKSKHEERSKKRSKSRSMPSTPQTVHGGRKMSKIEDDRQKRPSLPIERIFSTRTTTNGFKIQRLRSSSTDDTFATSKDSHISNDVFTNYPKTSHKPRRRLQVPILSSRSFLGLGQYEIPILNSMKSSSMSNVPSFEAPPHHDLSSKNLHSYENFVNSFENLNLDEDSNKHGSVSGVKYADVITGNEDSL